MARLLYIALLAGILFSAFSASSQCSNYAVTVSSGFWPGEVSWTLVNSNGVTVASGWAPYSATYCLEPGCYTLYMYDSYGDGWNNSYFNLSYNGLSLVYVTLPAGSYGTYTFEIGGGSCNPQEPCTDYDIVVGGGDFEDNVTWALIDDGGNTVLSGAAPFVGSECLDPGCYTLEMYDTLGDGWQGCYFTMSDNGQVVQQFSLSWGYSGSYDMGLGDAPCGQLTTADCLGAITVCQDIYSETSAPIGVGQYGYELNGSYCNDYEVNSTWYTFTVQETGLLRFVLDPNNDYDDYDWALFDITETGCLSFGNYPSVEVSCNSYGVYGGAQGPTGISSLYGGYDANNGPGNLNGPPWNSDLSVTAGQTYALVVMNWSNSIQGYTLNFSSSTAEIYDDIPPQMTAVISSCEGSFIEMEFSEPVRCATLQPLDFPVSDGVNTYYPATVSAPECELGGVLSTTVTLEFSPPLPPGDYTFSVGLDGGGVTDACDNPAYGDIPCSSIFMPVELISFKAVAEGCSAILSWTTGSEHLSDHFEIERSTNGQEWTALGSVQAAGESNATRTYFTEDNSCPPGTVYYRLWLVNINGSKEEEGRISFSNNCSGVSIFPNPNQGSFTVQGISQECKLVIFDASGREVLFYTIPSNSDRSLRIALLHPLPGMYTVRLFQAGETQHFRIIVSDF